MTDPKEQAAAALADAPEAAVSIRARNADPLPGEARDGVRAGEWYEQADDVGLPPDCPLVPLGFSGDRPRFYYFLDPTKSLQIKTPSEFSKQHVQSLFQTRSNFLMWAWPSWKAQKDGHFVVDTFDNGKAAPALMDACGLKGAWDPVSKVRGRGAWLAKSGELVLHCGHDLFVGGRQRDTGEVDGFVYPRLPKITYPWPERVSDKKSPAVELVTLLRTWRWERPDVDPVLFFGWIAAALIGGALPVRPVAYVSGDSGIGKTTLQRLLSGVLGETLMTSTNATEAGVSQRINADALAVSIDEMEPTVGSSKAKHIIELARQAYSGGLRLRGSADHKPVEMKAQSMFIFSSINQPPLEPQDLSRMVLFNLMRIKADAPRPVIDVQALGVLGRKILRRMMDGYDQLPGMVEFWREELSQAGHTARGQDTFGVLLACAELAMGPVAADQLEVPLVDDVAIWREWLAPTSMAENEGRISNAKKCLRHLMAVQIDAYEDGLKPTVGQLLAEYLLSADGGPGLARVQKMLATIGVGLPAPQKWAGPNGMEYKASLAIPNRSDLLNKAYANSPWAAGGWSAAIRQAEKVTVWRDGQARVGGVSQPCKMVDLHYILDDEAEPVAGMDAEGGE